MGAVNHDPQRLAADALVPEGRVDELVEQHPVPLARGGAELVSAGASVFEPVVAVLAKGRNVPLPRGACSNFWRPEFEVNLGSTRDQARDGIVLLRGQRRSTVQLAACGRRAW